MGQEPVLYARSIRENIAYGLEACTPERVEEAARNANAHDFIMEMKDKYETEAGEKGAQLSGKTVFFSARVRSTAVVINDRIRRIGEGNVSVCPHRGGGGGGGTPRYLPPPPGQGTYPPARTGGRGYPKILPRPRYLPPPPGIGQHMEYLIRCCQYASCVHAGGLSSVVTDVLSVHIEVGGTP